MSRYVHLYPRASAMNGALEFTIPGKGYVTVFLPWWSTRRGWPWGAYFSPNGTPWHPRARGVGPYWRLRAALPSSRETTDG